MRYGREGNVHSLVYGRGVYEWASLLYIRQGHRLVGIHQASGIYDFQSLVPNHLLLDTMSNLLMLPKPSQSASQDSNKKLKAWAYEVHFKIKS